MAPPTEQRVWDLPVRLFHWTLVLAVAGAYLTHRLGIRFFRYHVWCGYTVLVLVGFRLLWGFVGTRNALFRNFLRGPVTTLRYGLDLLRQRDQHYAGHNPLGGWMVMLLLAALLSQAVLGLFGNDEILNFGPLYGYVTNDRSLALTSLHRRLFYWIAGAIVLHVLAVVYHRVARGENLTRAMFTGRKPVAVVPVGAAIESSRLMRAVAIAALLAAALAWLVAHAPVPQNLTSFD